MPPDKCREIQKREPLFHCRVSINFLPGNVVRFMYTDIMNREKYELTGNQVKFYSREFGRFLIFTLSDDLQTMVDQAGNVFRLNSAVFL